MTTRGFIDLQIMMFGECEHCLTYPLSLLRQTNFFGSKAGSSTPANFLSIRASHWPVHLGKAEQSLWVENDCLLKHIRWLLPCYEMDRGECPE